MNLHLWRRRTRGQTRQETLLVILVCAITVVAMLSVFVAPLRHLWVGLGRMIMR